MTNEQSQIRLLSPHQKRVIAALLALEQSHDWRWWPRYAIGSVVAAGGYHVTVQRRTMRILKSAGLIQTERNSWSNETRQLVRCGCACCCWGLTESGRNVAEQLAVRWTDDARQRINNEAYRAMLPGGDEDDAYDDDDDSDGDR